jgi:hypothetical protein
MKRKNEQNASGGSAPSEDIKPKGDEPVRQASEREARKYEKGAEEEENIERRGEGEGGPS